MKRATEDKGVRKGDGEGKSWRQLSSLTVVTFSANLKAKEGHSRTESDTGSLQFSQTELIISAFSWKLRSREIWNSVRHKQARTELAGANPSPIFRSRVGWRRRRGRSRHASFSIQSTSIYEALNPPKPHITSYEVSKSNDLWLLLV